MGETLNPFCACTLQSGTKAVVNYNKVCHLISVIVNVILSAFYIYIVSCTRCTPIWKSSGVPIKTLPYCIPTLSESLASRIEPCFNQLRDDIMEEQDRKTFLRLLIPTLFVIICRLIHLKLTFLLGHGITRGNQAKIRRWVWFSTFFLSVYTMKSILDIFLGSMIHVEEVQDLLWKGAFLAIVSIGMIIGLLTGLYELWIVYAYAEELRGERNGRKHGDQNGQEIELHQKFPEDGSEVSGRQNENRNPPGYTDTCNPLQDFPFP